MRRDIFAEGRALRQRAIALGDVRGVLSGELMQRLGPAQSYHHLAGGVTLYQWWATGYRIALLCEADGRCRGVQSEYCAPQIAAVGR